ncbi:MAG: FkbM family methyltransferase [Candidatus Sulfotelmatobacter sp.]
MSLKNLIRAVTPNGICEYSIRRHGFMRLAHSASQATFAALSPRKYRNLCDSRLNLLPQSILSTLLTCVDAGANAGNWTQALLDSFRPTRVIAVECEPRMVGPLKARFSALPQVTVLDVALAESAGVAAFHQLRHPAGSSLLKPRDEVKKQFADNSWDLLGTVEVRKIGYDQLVADEEEISILKLDIQGAERSVISSSQQGLDKTKSIILEVTFTPHYEDDAGFSELHQLMAGKGFGLYRLSPAYDRGARALYADAVYVREDILRTLAPER